VFKLLGEKFSVLAFFIFVFLKINQIHKRSLRLLKCIQPTFYEFFLIIFLIFQTKFNYDNRDRQFCSS